MDQELIQISSLILRHLEGRLSAYDAQQLESWKRADPLNARLFEELTDRAALEHQLNRLRAIDVHAALERFKHANNTDERSTPVQRPRVLVLRRKYWLGAAVMLMAAVSLFLLVNTRRVKNGKEQAHVLPILPRDSGAILTLSDGSQVLLDTIRDGIVALHAHDSARIVNGSLVYGAGMDRVAYNSMSTRTGTQYHLTLSDGTGVWLNSLSSIRYPTAFKGAERLVEISGEAYFEVARNKKLPFRVKIDEQSSVTVLGTSFNINSYRDERSVNTTLLEGLVRVNSGRDSISLSPGEQTQLRPSGGIIRTVALQDVSTVVAWKNGLFSFNNAGIEEMTRELKRWYGIDTRFEGPVPDKIFKGELDRGVKLEAVLNWFTALGIKNRLEGNTLIISNQP